MRRSWAKLGLAFGLVGMAASSAMAQVTVTAPVDVEDYVAASVTVLGTVVGAVIAAMFGFLIVRKAFRWAKRIG